MLNNKKGISLIETLISLTIVGIALVAFLPVMTVKQHTFANTEGDTFFDKVEQTPQPTTYYMTKKFNKNYWLGEYDSTYNLVNPVPKFLVNARGYIYANTPALYVTERLYFNNNKIKYFQTKNTLDEITNQGLFITSGDKFDIGARLEYPMSIFLDNDDVVIGNPGVASYNTWKSDYANWKTAGAVGAAPAWSNLSFIAYQTGANTWNMNNGDPSNYFDDNHVNSLENGDIQYINSTNNTANNYTHIGIGANAIVNRNRTGGITSTGVAILNDTAKSISNGDTVDLAIGKLAGAAWSTPSTFVIAHDRGSDGIPGKYTINAPVDMDGHTITVNSVIISSDKRLKTILKKYKRGLKELLKINPIEFVYKSDKNKQHHIGVIAQDIKKVIPEAVNTNKNTGFYMVSTQPVFYALLNSIKELNNKNIALEKQNDKLEQKIAQLKKMKGGKM